MGKFLFKSVITVAVILFFLSALAGTEKEGLVISGDKSHFSPCPYMSLFEDKSGALKFQDIQKMYLRNRFQKNRKESFNLGITSSTFWIHFQVTQRNVALEKRNNELIFDLRPAFPGRIKWQLFEASSGALPGGEGYMQGDKKLVRLKVSEKPSSFFLKVSSDTGLLFKPHLYRWKSYIDKEKLSFIFLGIFFGIIMVVFFYNLVLSFSLNDLSFLWYCLHLVFLFLYFFGINGLTGTYILPDNPEAVGMINRTFLGMMSVTMALLARSFLITRDKAPLIDRFLLVLCLLSFLLSIGNFLLPARMVNTSLAALGLIVPLVTIVAAGSSYRNGFHPALLFMYAWGFYLVAIMLFAFTVGGMVPFTYAGFYGFQWSSAVTALLLSIALRDRILTLKREHAQYKDTMTRVTMILDSIESGIFLIEKDTSVIKEINRAAEKIIGKSKNEIVGRLYHDFVSNEEGAPFFEKKQGDEKDEAVLIGESGEEIPVLLSAKIIELDGHILILTSFVDITERKKMERDLKLMATTDPLTGAHNRRSFYERGEEEIIRSKRYQNRVSILMIDVDHFKKINDTYGHSIGDEVLKELTARSHETIRKSDVFARMGGEEFAIMLTETSMESARILAERLLKALSSLEISSDKGTVTFTVSIGIAEFASEKDTLDIVISQADRALYSAKESGRNRVVLYAED